MSEALIPQVFIQRAVTLNSIHALVILANQSGKKFIPKRCWLHITGKSGTGTQPVVKIGNGGAYEIHNAAALPAHNLDDIVELTLDGSARVFAVNIGTTGISITVSTASTYTGHQCTVYLEGFIV